MRLLQRLQLRRLFKRQMARASSKWVVLDQAIE